MTNESVPAFPLAWPHGRQRTPAGHRKRAAFGTKAGGSAIKSLTLAQGRERAMDELHRFGASGIVISTNRPLRLDGLPTGEGPDPQDVGVAVYFTLGKRARVIACDRWDRVADNLAAIAKTIEAQRAMLRHGAVTAEQIFEGFKALPSPAGDANRDATAAAIVLSTYAREAALTPAAILNSGAAFAAAMTVARRLTHPDHNGGDDEGFLKVQRAGETIKRHHHQQ